MNDVVALQAIYRFNVAKSFPIGEEASFEAISEKCGLNVVDLKRLLRMAMTNHIFDEPRKGVVVHTAGSRLLAEDRELQDYVGMRTEDIFPAAAKVEDGRLAAENLSLTSAPRLLTHCPNTVRLKLQPNA